ncbi:uncharacterized protein RHOBADRAFT_56035 [Rhodotorula graminis WP1]|uniref:NADP-dependent oxidoreductase domain-containing protein n=1 Tax=Rhodotorula graminis (strain WP1) TaxID=578459 RepID=A0A0P9GXQ4_RHOGW|nr:uncharacterized protein RHOBADRAFT_56035 [Rhodotorula graminis WP1]KPV72218.1 hypothetical protein RHOBADRAFT_56035 [Rhodotorula graminis WP1]
MTKTVQLDASTAVPVPGFGAMGMSAFYGEHDDDTSKQTLRKAIEIGCTVIDSAFVYGMGHNERLIGDVLREGDNRKKVFLISKFGIEINDKGELETDGSPENVIRSIDRCIENLGGLYPDAYLQHRVDKKTPIEETVRALDAVRKEGKTKYIGLSECSADTLRRAAKVAKIDFVEVEYSPWELTMEKNGIIDACKELGVKILAYSPLGRGFLTGRYKSPEDFATADGSDFRANLPRFAKENWERNYRIVQEFERVAAKKGCTPAQLALSWLIHQGDNIIPIPGTKSSKYLVENFAATSVDLSPDELAEVRKVIEDNQPVGTRYAESQMASLEG